MTGELITRDRQIEWRGLLMGAGTRIKVTAVTGWLDLPEQRGNDPILTGRHGTYPGQRLSSGRTITADLSITAPAEEFPRLLDTLRQATAPDEDPVEEPLVIRVRGQAWMVWARCTRRAIPTDRAFLVGHTRASVQWQATDPRLYSVTEQTAETGLPAPAQGGLRFPLAFPLDFGPGRTGGELVAENLGHVPTWPALDVLGPCPGPVITVTSGGNWCSTPTSPCSLSKPWSWTPGYARSRSTACPCGPGCGPTNGHPSPRAPTGSGSPRPAASITPARGYVPAGATPNTDPEGGSLMPERPSWAAMNGTTPILDGESSRLALAALWTPAGAVAARPGRRPAAGDPLRVTASSPTPDTKIRVAPGQGVLAATRGRGEYITTLDTAKSIDILTTRPADGANARWDLIVAQQTDTFYGDSATNYVVRHVVGTASQQPRDPDVDGSPDYQVLARIRVPAQATAITAAMIDDLRPPFAVALGGLLPVTDATDRAKITTPYEGQPIYRMDRDWVEVHDGTAWRVQGTAVCSSTADRDAAITAPYPGQLAITTDLGIAWQYLAGAWKVPGPLGIIGGRVISGLNPLGAAVTTTEVAPTNMDSGTVALLPNRHYLIHCRYKAASSAVDEYFLLRIREGSTPGTGGNQLRQLVYNTLPAGFGCTQDLFADYETGAAPATKVFTLTAARVGGTGALQFQGGDTGSTNLVGVWVEDKGPAGKLTALAS
ncbi:hypothetical protein [Actinocrispum wychmicini]|uniref:Tail protein n=1 Tax=Actinocrispum wychmicini TaxID=1213861 RepID=A0A4R2JVA9_9PSEU|nr:hypothetical protein [Actinocrispum wychmicini]TCO64391.1 hypothetical protein EV192_101159 [Actinocrispum wychmicini]